MLGAACGTSSPSSSPGAASPGASSPVASASPTATAAAELPPEFAGVFDIPADPIAVTPTLDDAHAAEQLIAIEGGQLTATAADGTTYVLDVPGDALVLETTIRMTPVSAIAGMPFGSDPHAVQLEPEGLHFVNFVTLTVTPPAEIPVDQQILFGYDGSGENLGLALPVVDSKAIAIRLLHFSGAGVTTGTAAQAAQAAPRLGTSAEARITSAIAAELTRARNAALLGIEYDPLDPDVIFDLLAQLRREVVDPRIAAAGTSCAAGRLAIQTLLGWARNLALLGALDEGSPEEVPSLIKTVEKVCVREEYERCRDHHVIQNMIPAWLGGARQFALLGVPEGDPAYEELATYVRKCLVFEMTFESEASLNEATGGWDSSVRSTFDLRYDTDFMRFRLGQSELVNFFFKFKASTSGCTVTSTPGGGTFNSIDFTFFRDTRTPNDLTGYVRDLEFGYTPGATSESVSIRCPKGSTTIPNAGFWSASFLKLHRGEAGDHDGHYSFIADDWEIFGNAYYAKKEWIKQDRKLVEAGTFKLYHTPE